jgi:5S rRNA maturation endonuclease (ribonuclease M5)
MSQLNEAIIENITKILDHFGVDHKEKHTCVALTCPMHASSKPDSLTISLKEKSLGVWHCWTNSCEEEIIVVKGEEKKRGKYVTSLIAFLLEVKYNKPFSQWETLKWCSKFLNVQLDQNNQNNLDYVKIGRILSKDRIVNSSEITRQLIRSTLKIPSKYFIERGFKPEILDRYDVGYCNTPKKEMYTRVVVPVYDDNYKFMVGCVGRSINPKCPKCGGYHYSAKECPTNPIETKWAAKWINNDKFNRGNYLYNFWFAKEHIAKTGNVILVEGQGDVWRLEEAGLHNGLGLFGSSLGDQQKMALDSLNAFNLIIATDNDETGLKARETIKQKCERYYNIYFVDLDKKDIGDMTKDEILKTFEPILEKL